MTVLSRQDILKRIARGEAIFLRRRDVYQAHDSWLKQHPGGGLVIQHYIGRDAEDEVVAYHGESALRMMQAYKIGVYEGDVWNNCTAPIQGGSFNVDKDSSNGECIVKEPQAPELLTPADEYDSKCKTADLAKYPSLSPGTQGKIISEYRKLQQILYDKGYFNCTYWGYGRELMRYIFLAYLSWISLQCSWYLTSAFFLGLFWHQLVFTAHDAGHMAITHDYLTDGIIGVLIADFLGGLSLGWWKLNHNIHHVVTNHPQHDPDIQHIPILAVSTRFFSSLRSTYYNRILHFDKVAQVMIQIQAYTFYVVMLFGRFNLYRLSWEYLFTSKVPLRRKTLFLRYLEILGTMTFWYWFGYRLLYLSLPDNRTRFFYVLISHMATMPVHVQINLSHFSMSTSDLGVKESFPQRMLRTTMDVDCPPWLDFFHGGLQFQVIHHLFPRMPRHNFRAAQPLVKQFCKDVGIDYVIYGFADGNRDVLRHLDEIAKQAKMMHACLRQTLHEHTS